MISCKCYLRPRLVIKSLLAAIVAVPSTAYPNAFSELSIAGGFEDNINRGLDEPNIIDSTFSALELSGGRFFQHGLRGKLTVFGSLGYDRFFESTGFDVFATSLGVAYDYRMGLGPYATTVSSSVAFENDELRGKGRDRQRSLVNLGLSKRFDYRFSANLGLEYLNSSAESLGATDINYPAGADLNNPSSFEVYDFEAVSASVGFNYQLDNEWLLSLDYNYSRGATVASTKTPGFLVYHLADAFYRDDALGFPYVAYQLETTTDEWSLSLNAPVGLDSSLDLRYSWQDIDGPQQFDYDNSSIRLTLIHRF